MSLFVLVVWFVYYCFTLCLNCRLICVFFVVCCLICSWAAWFAFLGFILLVLMSFWFWLRWLCYLRLTCGIDLSCCLAWVCGFIYDYFLVLVTSWVFIGTCCFKDRFLNVLAWLIWTLRLVCLGDCCMFVLLLLGCDFSLWHWFMFVFGLFCLYAELFGVLGYKFGCFMDLGMINCLLMVDLCLLDYWILFIVSGGLVFFAFSFWCLPYYLGGLPV